MTDTNAKQPTIPWVRIGVEGAVIVGSILLAFWIDAGWEQRQDRAQAKSLLIALLDDFESAAVQLDTMEAQHGRLVQNGQRLIEYGEMGGVPVEEQEQVDFLLGSHFLRPIFEPPMGTVQSLLSSGRLDLFDNELLVGGLTNWAAAVASLQRTQTDAREHFYNRLYPYLTTRVDLEDLDKGFAEYLGHPLPFEQGVTDAHRLLEDQELLNILYAHWVLNVNAFERDIPKVRTALDGIRSQTEAEIGSG